MKTLLGRSCRAVELTLKCSTCSGEYGECKIVGCTYGVTNYKYYVSKDLPNQLIVVSKRSIVCRPLSFLTNIALRGQLDEPLASIAEKATRIGKTIWEQVLI